MTGCTSIEKRLRELSRQHAKWDSDATVPKTLLIEAADEIVMLRADIDALVAREQDD